MTPKTIKLSELRAALADCPDDTEIYFGNGDLSFYQPQTRLYRDGTNIPAMVQIDFNEVYTVTHDPNAS